MSGHLNAVVGVGFLPTNVSGLQLWFDAADSGSITQVAGAVSQWNDKSGNGNNATQAVGAQQPTIVSSGQNGLNTIKFVHASSQSLGFSTVNLDSAQTIIAVLKHVAGASTGPFGGTPGAWYPGIYWQGADNGIYVVNSTKGAWSAAQTSAGFHLVSVALDATPTGFVYLDGADVGTNAPQAIGWGTTASYSTIGSLYDAELAEVVAYNRVISSTERANIESYLKRKWATP